MNRDKKDDKSKKKPERNLVLDWGSKFLDAIRGGPKGNPEVAEGVRKQTETLYSTFGSGRQPRDTDNEKQKKETEGYAEKMAPTVVPNDDSDEARRKRARTLQHARDNGYL